MPLSRCPPRLSPRPGSLPGELPRAGRGRARRAGPQPALCVLCRRGKGTVRGGNIMTDPRVVRGRALSIRPAPQVRGALKGTVLQLCWKVITAAKLFLVYNFT